MRKTNSSRGSSLISALLVILLLASIVPAQVDQVAVGGTVTDTSGAVIQDANVELLSPATGFHREAVTDAAGSYRFPSLAIGAYKIRISKEGFRTVEVPEFQLAIGQPRTLDVQMEVGAVSNTIQVNATVEAINRSTAEVGGLVDTI